MKRQGSGNLWRTQSFIEWQRKGKQSTKQVGEKGRKQGKELRGRRPQKPRGEKIGPILSYFMEVSHLMVKKCDNRWKSSVAFIFASRSSRSLMSEG
jgi:hypothetical protein